MLLTVDSSELFAVSIQWFVAGLVGALIGLGGWSILRGANQAQERAQVRILYETVPEGDEPDSGDPPARRRAEARIDKLVGQYRRKLTAEAKRVAQAHSADDPSVAHVMMAANAVRLAPPLGQRLADVGLAVGAFALGIPVAVFVNVLTGGTASPGAVPWLIGVGAFALVLLTASGTTKVWK